MLNYKTFILLELFEVVFFSSQMFGSTENLIDGLPGDGDGKNPNWPTFVTNLRAGTVITTASEPKGNIQQPHIDGERVECGPSRTATGIKELLV